MKTLKKLFAVVLSVTLIFSCMYMGYAVAENAEYNYYCGFEAYTEQIEGMSLDSEVATIVTDTYYAGEKALKLSLADGGITAFELRDSAPFDIVAGKEYTVTFAYKATADVKFGLGMASAGNVTKTAKADVSVDAAASEEWASKTVTLTPDKSADDAYVMAMLVYTSSANEVYIDDITITFYSEGKVALENIDFGFDGSTFPKLNAFVNEDEVAEDTTQDIKIWDGSVAEAFAGGSGTESDPYQISNGAELALAITQSGTTTKTVTAEDGTETTETVNETYYGSYYILTADIYLNDVNAVNWLEGSKNSGYTVNTWYDYNENFAGTIDGDGHTVYGLYYYSGGTPDYHLVSGQDGSSLVPTVLSADTVEIKNLGVNCSYIRSRYNASAFVANGGATVANCYVGADVRILACDAGAFIGRSYSKSFTITNCYSLATVGYLSAPDSSCGLVGYFPQATATIKYSYNGNGALSTCEHPHYNTVFKFYNSYETEASGTNTKYSSRVTKTNVYQITADNMQGLDVFTHESKMMFLALDTSGAATTTYTATETYPVLTSFIKTEQGEEDSETEDTASAVWNGETTCPVDSDGDGVYEINTAEELAHIIKNGGVMVVGTEETDEGTTDVTSNECTFILTKDIYLNNISGVNWLEDANKTGLRSWYKQSDVTAFGGTIDGDGHTVYGLYVRTGNETCWHSMTTGTGFIPRVGSGKTATVKNLYIDYANITADSNAGAIIGNNNGGTVNIDSCVVGANVFVKSYRAGALMGSTNSTSKAAVITNCASFATVKIGTVASDDTQGGAYVSHGLVNETWTHTKIQISNSYNANGPITYRSKSRMTISNCYASEEGKITTGAVILVDYNMQGEDVLTSSEKMTSLNSSGNKWTATETYPLPSAFFEIEEAAYDIWDGTKTAPVDSDGDGVYEITNGAELAYIIANHGTMITGTETTTDETTGEEVTTNITQEACSFILTNDIYLNDISKINWVTGDILVGYSVKGWYNYTNYFEGSIDGNGYRILGLYYNNGVSAKAWGVYGSGLIPKVLHGDTVNISNLGIDCAYVNSDCGVSAFVGCAGSGNSATDTPANINITGCYVGANVGLVGYSTGAFQGAASGSLTYITDSYSLATLTGNATGLFAMTQYSSKTHISGCFNANGPISSSQAVASVANSYQTVSGKGLTTVTSVANMQGTDVLTNADKMPNLNAEAFTAVTQSFSDYDFYIYLPIGTEVAGEYELTCYNDLFVEIDTSSVYAKGVMGKGAYVKFNVQPELSDITVPAELSKYVRYGSKAELIASNPYYGVKMDIITDSITGDDSIKYAFVTDIHYIGGEDVARSLATIKELENLVKYVNGNDEIDFVAIGGDTIQGNQSKSTSLGYYKKAFTPFLSCNKPVFIVPGNHDDNSYAYDTKTFNGSTVITEVDWKNSILDVYVNRSTADGDVLDVSVIQDTEDEYSKYFYYDLEDKKTRVICLDANDYEMTCDENGSLTVDADGNVGLAIRNDSLAVTNYNRYYMSANYWGYGARQMVWLAEEAMQAGDDWDYVFISHMGIDEATNFNVGAEITWYGKDLRNIIKAYQFKTPYVNEELGIEVDFSATKGEILSYQYGHVHSQKRLYSEDIDLWQMSTITAQYRDGAFDIMNVNDNKIERYVIGRGFDETLIQTKDAIYGDTDLNNAVDICDLVKLNLVANGVDNMTTAADIDNNRKIEIITDTAALRKLIIK